MIHVYTDGAYSAVPVSAGGWAWWLDDAHQLYGGALDTTNNRMELQAVISALTELGTLAKLNGGITIHSDSLYVVDCFADGWYLNWRRNDWQVTDRKTKRKKPVANRDLWERLLTLYEQYLEVGIPVSFHHIRGHGKNLNASPVHVAGNDKADRLAVKAKKLLML